MARMGGGRVLPQYTPFFAKGMEGLGQAMGSRKERQIEERKNDLFSQAMMLKPGAQEQLDAMDPEMGSQAREELGEIQSRDRQKQLHTQAQEDRTLELEDRQRDFAKENKELLDSFMVDAGGFDTYEMAAEYTADQIGQLEAIMGPEAIPEKFKEPLPPELYEQMKKMREVVTGDDWEKSGGTTLEIGPDGKPRRVQAFVNPKTRETEVVPAGIGEAITGHDALQAAEKVRQTERAKSQEQREQQTAAAGLNAIYMMPDLKRAEELLERVKTGGLRAGIQSVRTYFGDESLDVADMGELQVLLANDLISKFELMTGVLSESDMKLLQDISAGTRAPAPVNMRLIQNVIRKAERKIALGEKAAREGGDPQLDQYEKYYSEREAPIGSIEANPVEVRPGDDPPPSGTWVRLPSGKIMQVP